MHWTPRANEVGVEYPDVKRASTLQWAGIIHDRHGNPVALKDNLNCQSEGVVYVIECKNCEIRYVGETCAKLKDRMNQHRSDINRKTDTTIATHFTRICPNINFLQVTPVEKIYSYGSRIIHLHRHAWQWGSRQTFSERTILDETPEDNNSPWPK